MYVLPLFGLVWFVHLLPPIVDLLPFPHICTYLHTGNQRVADPSHIFSQQSPCEKLWVSLWFPPNQCFIVVTGRALSMALNTERYYSVSWFGLLWFFGQFCLVSVWFRSDLCGGEVGNPAEGICPLCAGAGAAPTCPGLRAA